MSTSTPHPKKRRSASEPMAKISLFLPPDLKQKLDALADARRTPLAAILRTWIVEAYEQAPDSEKVQVSR